MTDFSNQRITAKMKIVLIENFSASSAHGISRAASTQSIPLKVCWILLFTGFLVLFCNSAVSVVNKLINVSIVTSSEIDKVPFEFPDLYFCHTDPISGSYPYALNESEATTVNNEVERLSKVYDEMMSSGSKWIPWISSTEKARGIKFSLSPQVLKLLIQRSEQSVNPFGHSTGISLQTTLSYYDAVCFKPDTTNLTKNPHRSDRSLVTPNSKFTADLFTDQYNPRFNYTGHPVKPIVDTLKNQTVDVALWGPENPYSLMHATGFTLIVVPQGAYPERYETSLRLEPGHSYDIALSMEEVVFSEELHGKNCTPDLPRLRFVDFLSGNTVEYNRSYQGCIIDRYIRGMHQTRNFTAVQLPILWDLRHSPRIYNLQEMFANKRLFLGSSPNELANQISQFAGKAVEFCQLAQPCTSRTFKATSVTSHKWSPVRGRLADAFNLLNKSLEHRPAIKQLAMAAQKLGSHLTQGMSEIELQNFLSDSMLSVNIKPGRLTSTRLVISSSYSWTSFLAEIGGLLGLYIGCSLLTVCELLELIYHLVVVYAAYRSAIRKKENCDQEMTVATAQKPDCDN